MPKKLTILEVKKVILQSGYIFAEEMQYLNAFQAIAVICKNGHRRKITINRLYKQQECAKCVSNKKKLSIDYVRSIFRQFSYTLISKTYHNAIDKLTVKCPKGHIWNVSVNKFKDRGQRCSDCMFYGGASKLEKELFEAIRTHYPSAKKIKRRRLRIKYRPYVKGFDIDIYIPELKRGIEFDGTYFHSYRGLKRSYPAWPDLAIKNYHIIKDEYFKQENIDLLHIKEKEWKTNKTATLKKCLAFLTPLAKV